MDLGTTITVIVILLIGVIPFALLNRSNKKREKEFLEALNKLADENNSKISSYDIWSNAAIGIDDTNSMIFFISKANGLAKVEQINIAEIQKCKLINSNRNFSSKGINSQIIDKLELVFTYFDKSKTENIWSIYDESINHSALTGELKLSQKWSKIVNEKIAILEKRK